MRVLRVFDDSEPNGNHKLLGTITEVADSEPVCDPESLAGLLNRPKVYGVDPFRALDGWTNGYVTCEMTSTPKPARTVKGRSSDGPNTRVRPQPDWEGTDHVHGDRARDAQGGGAGIPRSCR